MTDKERKDQPKQPDKGRPGEGEPQPLNTDPPPNPPPPPPPGTTEGPGKQG